MKDIIIIIMHVYIAPEPDNPVLRRCTVLYIKFVCQEILKCELTYSEAVSLVNKLNSSVKLFHSSVKYTRIDYIYIYIYTHTPTKTPHDNKGILV